MKDENGAMDRVIRGTVIHGKGKGRTFGFPTANITYEKGDEDIKEGVYASFVIVRGKRYLGITNIGPRPSVDSDPSFTIETHILDFSEDIYSEIIELRLDSYLRPTRTFSSIGELKEQLEKDSKEAKRLLKTSPAHLV